MSGTSFRPFYKASVAPPFQANPASANFGENSVKNLSVEPQITYSKPIGKGRIDLLAGASLQSTTKKAQNILAMGFSSDALVKKSLQLQILLVSPIRRRNTNTTQFSKRVR